ncbi:MAG: Ppx/GppA family phosphatase [Acidimicrobiales bacterium]|nr:Ppx/GppA family phosphatase [Acidimicrobiales bacterium]
MSELIAAIDIGTNSFHLVVARLAADSGFEVVTTQKEVVRLGSGSGDMKVLAPDAIDRGIAALTRMTEVAESLGADVHAVATSAVREAENRAEFLDRARNEAGIQVEVISGFEEARLIHLGLLKALPVFDQRLMGFDIGGGSTELVVGLGSDLLAARSFRLGAIRLTERFFPGGVVEDADDVERCRHFVRQTLAGVEIEFVGHRPQILLASSGTAGTLAAMACASAGSVPTNLNGTTVSKSQLAELVALIIATKPGKRAKLPGLDERRADIIVGGAILAEQIVELSGLDGFTFSSFALREGVLLDRMPGAAADHLDDLRRTNVVRLSRTLDPDADHAQHCTKLALQLFDRTDDLHGCGPYERELLEMAGLLHNVGLFLSHSGHHKHSYYVIRNSEQLTGFNDNEIELIAQIARYHRKSHPSKNHEAYMALSKQDQHSVKVLAGILRIAIGLDRRHRASVASVRVLANDGLTIEPVPLDPDEDLSIEVHAANERVSLLSAALAQPVRISVPSVISPAAP